MAIRRFAFANDGFMAGNTLVLLNQCIPALPLSINKSRSVCCRTIVENDMEYCHQALSFVMRYLPAEAVSER